MLSRPSLSTAQHVSNFPARDAHGANCSNRLLHNQSNNEHGIAPYYFGHTVFVGAFQQRYNHIVRGTELTSHCCMCSLAERSGLCGTAKAKARLQLLQEHTFRL